MVTEIQRSSVLYEALAGFSVPLREDVVAERPAC